MRQIYDIRKAHQGTYLTAFPDGTIIPWKPLSINDWIKYSRDYNRGVIPDSYLEDEIFRKCVLDQSFIRQLDHLAAGKITTVVTNIWQFSGPLQFDSLVNDLNTSRQLLQSEGIEVIHQLATLISTAFPYKPEEVYALDYETLLLRAMQAEQKLLLLGIIQEPIQITKQANNQQSTNAPRKPRVDAKKLYDEQQKKKKQPTPPPQTKEKWWNVSPVLESENPTQIDFAIERQADDLTVLDNHDRREPPEIRNFIIQKKTKETRAKMVEDAKVIYKDLIAEMRNRRANK